VLPCPKADLNNIFCLQWRRTVNRDNTVIFEPALADRTVRWRPTLAGCNVTVQEHLGGTLKLNLFYGTERPRSLP